MAARVGNLFHTSAIPGKDVRTGVLPDDHRRQMKNMFENARLLLAEAGINDSAVVYANVLLSSEDLRNDLNEHWREWFPDPADRPARHVTVRALPFGMACQLSLQAYASDH
jgi:2-iminobutanoate/2-iminopropanoate deaminase